MTGQTLLAVLGVIGIPTLVTVFLNFLSNRQTLKRTAPKTDAEADEITSRANTQIIANLREEVKRLDEKATAAVLIADAAEKLADERDAQMRKNLRDQRAEFEQLMADMKSDHKKETDRLRASNKMLILHVERLTDWAQRNYRDGNSDKLGPPPALDHNFDWGDS